MNIAPIDGDNRVQLPGDWLESLGLRGLVALERTGDGILIRPHRPATWDEIFASKLVVGSAPPEAGDEALEVTGDAFLF